MAKRLWKIKSQIIFLGGAVIIFLLVLFFIFLVISSYLFGMNIDPIKPSLLIFFNFSFPLSMIIFTFGGILLGIDHCRGKI